jgi:ferrous iron transport protein B
VLYQLGEETNEKSEGLISKLQNPESGIKKLSAFAFMVFVLLYTPCIVSVIAIKREIGFRWMWFAVAYQFILAWVASFIVYQGGKILGLG